MNRAQWSVYRVGLIAHNTVREAVRQRLHAVLLALALGLVVGAQYFRELSFGAPELKFVADVGFGAIGVFGAILTVGSTAQLFFSELEHRTVLTLLARPVGRAEFVVGKYLGTVVMVAAFCAGLTGLLGTILWARETTLMREYPDAFSGGPVISYAAVAATGLLLWLKLAVLGAMTLLVASYAQSQIFTVVAGFMIMAICHLQYLAQDAATRATLPVLRVGARLLAWVFPNFHLFGEAAVAGGMGWGQLGGVALYALGYVAAAVALASVIFSHREI